MRRKSTSDRILVCRVACPQGEDDWQHLLHDLSSSPTLPESTALIWGSSEEVGAEARPDSSCSGSILQPDSPSGDSTRVSGWVGHSLDVLRCDVPMTAAAMDSSMLCSMMATSQCPHRMPTCSARVCLLPPPRA